MQKGIVVKLIIQTYKYYFKGNFLAALGVAICTAVVTGALIIGDSLSHSLNKSTDYRLGNISHIISAGNRFFTQELAHKIDSIYPTSVTPVLKLDALGSSEGGEKRINKIQLWGIDEAFYDVVGNNYPSIKINPGSVLLSENTARRLALEQGDVLVLKIKKASAIPTNSPFISEEDQFISRRVQVIEILDKTEMGRLNLNISQTAPFNAFVSIDWLNEIMDLDNKCNLLLVEKTHQSNNHELDELVHESWSLEDAGLHLKQVEQPVQWEITSESIFIDSIVSSNFESGISGSTPILTYFVNSISHKNFETPYSFVSAIEDTDLDENDIIINEWLADDLSASLNDSIQLKFFVIGRLRDLKEKSKTFRIKKIVPIRGKYADKTLMPQFPGISEAGNCRDWNTSMPIQLDKIRAKDEQYWQTYKGTPKAFISLKDGEQLWKNRIGLHTAIRISNGELNKDKLKKEINTLIDPFRMNVQIRDVKSEGVSAAKNGVDFSQLFFGLSFFIMVSGLLLTILLLQFNLNQRKTQIGTFQAMGFSPKLIKTILLSEGLIVALIGTVMGTVLSLLYTKLIFLNLNKIWQAIVRTNILEVNIQTSSIVLGFGISLILAIGSLYYIINQFLKEKPSDLQKKLLVSETKISIKIKYLITVIFIISSIGILLKQFMNSTSIKPGLYFLAGALLLFAILFITDLLLIKYRDRRSLKFSAYLVSLGNLVRYRSRSMMVIVMLSIGTFLVISTGSNRRDAITNSDSRLSGTGGFHFMAESTTPIIRDLNKESVKKDLGLEKALHIAQLHVSEGDDASCLNLNRISQPRILGVDAQELVGRFKFITSTDDLNESKPWESLEQKIGNYIPVIADQGVIHWGLGKKVGDTLNYIDEKGETLTLKLIGGLASSVFQGSVIISNKHFTKHFPSISGTQYFLIEHRNENQDAILEDFNMTFRDYGWDMQLCTQKLAEFNTVENTYLSIFLALGCIGLLLGTIGLSIVLANSILERKREIALLSAVGLSRTALFHLLFREYFILLIVGVSAGLVTAIIATLPVFISSNKNLSLGLILILTLIILTNGILWIVLVLYHQIKRVKNAEVIRNN
jgi:ABC-type lipoprotein release transport system permease subunit